MSEDHDHVASDDITEGSQYSNNTSALIDDILANYRFECKPEVRFKFKKRFPDFSVCAAYCKPWDYPPRWRYTIKPDECHATSKYVRKLLVVPSRCQAALFSSKLALGLFRLQLSAGFDWRKKRPTLDYKITTKWSDGQRIKRKEVLPLSDRTKIRCKWNLDVTLPDMEGHLGHDDEPDAPAVDVDYGGLNFDITQLDACLDF